MANERKCPACGEWTNGHITHCTQCGALTDPTLIAEESRNEREKDRRADKLRNESKTAKRFRALKGSDKLIHRIIFFIANTLFTIYMGILSFVVWLIALITG